MSVNCIACGSAGVEPLGPLPLYISDAPGMSELEEAPTGVLYRCPDCALRFQMPLPAPEWLTDFYSNLPSEALWDYGEEREVWKEIAGALATCPERSVLDVGCFRGDFLAYMGPGWRRCGVEMSTAARTEAERRGIEVIAASVETLDTAERFGAVTLIDVIEHLPQPLESLRKLVRLLVPGGNLVIFTGTTDAWAWRFSGLLYYYSALPDHIAFFDPSWFRWAAPRLGCRVSLIRRMTHEPASARRRLDEALKNIAYVTYHRLRALPLAGRLLSVLPVVNRIGRWNSCWWTTARDHILVVLTREETEGAEAAGTEARV